MNEPFFINKEGRGEGDGLAYTQPYNDFNLLKLRDLDWSSMKFS